MDLIHHRFDATLLATLAGLRARRERFRRLLDDRSTRVHVTVRTKSPRADLKRKYRGTLAASTGLSFALHAALFILHPTFESRPIVPFVDQIVIQMENVPETRQIQRPPPLARPAMPIEVGEEDDVPDDVTISSTDLDFDQVFIDIPPPPPGSRMLAHVEEEEGALEFWQVEVKPRIVSTVAPRYPELARKVGLEGSAFVRILIGSDGRVRKAVLVKGDEIFSRAATEALLQWVFEPAIQNLTPVAVWAVLPVEFNLTED
ncbi:MAG: TonB family protein [Candidatus Latescibacteria bacterium]|jgi:protein TonB|nr:TonB family protein [Candidatus Latescibacterota bacterium]